MRETINKMEPIEWEKILITTCQGKGLISKKYVKKSNNSVSENNPIKT